MKITFHINYRTEWGESLLVSGNAPELGNNNVAEAAVMQCVGGEHWRLTVDINTEESPALAYKYAIRGENGVAWEWGKPRVIHASVYPEMDLWDFWRPTQIPQNALHSSAFTRAIMKRKEKYESADLKITGQEAIVIFRLNSPRIAPHHVVGLIGSDANLGAWNKEDVLLMSDANYPVWEVPVGIKSADKTVHYKYVLYDTKAKKIVAWETGDDRQLFLNLLDNKEKTLFVQTDEDFRYEKPWKGGGVAVPVFSLRSTNGNGVGEFPDLHLLTDWALQTGLKVIQILPVNDTIANHTWTDSYPYAAISVAALHPMYVNLQKMGTLNDKTLQAEFEAERERLNQLPEIDYEGVMKMKSRYFKLLFDQEKKGLYVDKDFQAFIQKNAEWLKPYAVFSHLRDLYNTPDFSQWKIASVFDRAEIEQMCMPEDEHYQHIAIHFFIQYNAHLQLLAEAMYARENGVVLKGDIPIGIYRYSVDAWTAPELYNMNAQAGAPPDDFAVLGQNWGFPTYNWEEMAKDNYAWWRKRMTQLSTYFDSFRIDHILGFFRIWQMPANQVDGLMGVFNPCLPFSWEEIRSAGIHLDYERLCKPYIREYFLYEIFAEHTGEVKEKCLSRIENGNFVLQAHVTTQKDAENWVNLQDWSDDKKERIRLGLNELIRDVLFFDNGNNGLNPRISIQGTRSFQALDADQKGKIERLYTDYFFYRHNEFWREQAMKKLPPLLNATDMLICGEDLGMIPASVAGVMKELGILSLEIQRMPKGNVEFGHPDDAPYLSVVSPSSHDMSTVRGWWEEDAARSKRFFYDILQNMGEIPFYCETWVCRQIIEQHSYSPAMLAIFPLQDLVAMDNNLRRENPQSEQINVPANPKHYWRFRFHLPLEQLLQAGDLNEKIRGIMEGSGRHYQ